MPWVLSDERWEYLIGELRDGGLDGLADGLEEDARAIEPIWDVPANYRGTIWIEKEVKRAKEEG